ncbi:kinase-like protein [Tuber magnatum]|uniref:Kinase-like protein n=1 Tax=Tuber magnatum TaxID=42249 RepID=A0A317T5H7_9PEZI|nr:kinase-like protein [Tuber magnatum]
MDKTQSDLVVWYKLETEFFQDHVRHTRYVEQARNRNRRVKEDWSNCEKLGEGGFGVVYKQIQKTTGRCRAVKTIDKRRLPRDLDYSRELLVMAILAKRPSLFVEFLGWFEEPEILYIAMEYLGEGDLTKHIGTPLPQGIVQNISKQILEGLKVMHEQGIAHRDLKPANIFVVSMSPVWVKLGDFGISKRIQTQSPTTFHTQVLTQAYSAPEVLGLDSNSETSDYTDSVDIWSLGCVIYELLVGTKLFTEGRVYRYFFGKWPFPEDELKRLSPPTDDVGISLLKSMLQIQPENRPTAAGALGHEWFVGLKSDDEDSGDDEDETAQNRDESIRIRKRENKLTAHDKPKKRGERNPITQDDTPGEVTLRANPVSLKSGLTADPLQLPGDSFQLSRGAEGKTDPQYSTNMFARPPTSAPPTPDPHPGNSPQSTLGADGQAERTTKHNSAASTPDAHTTRIAHRRTYPTRMSRFRSDDSESSEDDVSQNSTPKARDGGGSGGRGGTTTNPTKNPNNPNIGQNPNAGANPGQSPNVGLNPNAGGNPNNTGWKLKAGGNPNLGWNPNVGGNPNIGWGLNTGRNPNARWGPNIVGNRGLGLNPHLARNPNLMVTEP